MEIDIKLLREANVEILHEEIRLLKQQNATLQLLLSKKPNLYSSDTTLDLLYRTGITQIEQLQKDVSYECSLKEQEYIRSRKLNDQLESALERIKLLEKQLEDAERDLSYYGGRNKPRNPVDTTQG